MKYTVNDLISDIKQSFKNENIDEMDCYADGDEILNLVKKTITKLKSKQNAKLSTKRIALTGEEFCWLFDDIFTQSPTFTITEDLENAEFIEKYWEDYLKPQTLEVLIKLKGFTIEVVCEGEHTRDDTDVPYHIVFKSPTGFITTVKTSGNYCIGIRDVEVNLLA